jgi:hypothetical protein
MPYLQAFANPIAGFLPCEPDSDLASVIVCLRFGHSSPAIFQKPAVLAGFWGTRPTAWAPTALARPASMEAAMADKRVYVERRPQGDYAVRRANSERASDILPTQAKAIERARELSPDSSPHVERVRNTTVGSPDKWRKV